MHEMAHPGINIKKWMDSRGLSEGGLAKLARMHQPTVHRIVNQKAQSPKYENVEKLAKAFGRTAEEAYDPKAEDIKLDPEQEAEQVAALLSGLTRQQVSQWQRMGLTEPQINLLRRIVSEFRKAAER